MEPREQSRVQFPLVADRSALLGRNKVLARPSPVPSSAGIYAWYFDELPPGIDTNDCQRVGDLTLLYVGISPKEPPTNGRPPSRSTLRKRLRTHFAGNAEGSTLRKTLGCLLAERLGIQLRRVGSGTRYTFTNPGEQILDEWMDCHAFVVFHEANEPWAIEREILSRLSLPLNIRNNQLAHLTEVTGRARERAMQIARELPVVIDAGGPRRRRPPP